MNEDKKVIIKVFLLFIPAAYITYLFHEFGHWIVGEILGNNMVYSLNGVWPKDGYFLKSSHGLYVFLGGPVFTIIQSILILLFIEKYKVIYLYPFVFFPVFSRYFTLILGGFAAQDEAKISAALGIGAFTIAIIVLLILLLIILKSSRLLKIGLKNNCYFMAIGTVCLILVIQTSKMLLP